MHQSLMDKSGSQFINGFWTYFRDNAQIRSDISCSVAGNNVRVSNGMEAAAFAVETDGKVVYYGDRPNFTVPAGKWNATSKIYAIPIETAKPYVQIYPKP